MGQRLDDPPSNAEQKLRRSYLRVVWGRERDLFHRVVDYVRRREAICVPRHRGRWGASCDGTQARRDLRIRPRSRSAALPGARVDTAATTLCSTGGLLPTPSTSSATAHFGATAGRKPVPAPVEAAVAAFAPLWSCADFSSRAAELVATGRRAAWTSLAFAFRTAAAVKLDVEVPELETGIRFIRDVRSNCSIRRSFSLTRSRTVPATSRSWLNRPSSMTWCGASSS
jgi:hypothetical protein